MTITRAELARALEAWRDGDLDACGAATLHAALADATARAVLDRELRLLGRLPLACEDAEIGARFTRAVHESLTLEQEAPRFAAAWRRRSLRRRRLGVAAAALLVAGIATATATALAWPRTDDRAPAQILVDGRPRPAQPGVLVADAGRARHVEWPSRACRVRVAPGGRLLLWREHTRLGLELAAGSASFQAGAQDPQRPLRVRIPDCELQVLGTRWHCRVADQGTAVTVYEGAVALQSPRAQATCTAGRFALVTAGGDVTVQAGDQAAAAAALRPPPPDPAPESSSQLPPDPAPELLLVPDLHAAPASKPLLALSATAVPSLHLEVRHRDVVTTRGDGLPGPWKAQNWDEDGYAELFAERIAGVTALTMRNIRSHGIMLTTWRRVTVPAGQRCHIVVRYRCRERGRLALAINVDGQRSATVQAPRIHDAWHTAVLRFDSGDSARETTVILLNQTTGPAHDVLLRDVALHVVGPSP